MNVCVPFVLRCHRKASGAVGCGGMPIANARSWASEPLNRFVSTPPAMPGAERLSVYCQNVHRDHGPGMSGHSDVYAAIHSAFDANASHAVA